MPNITYKLRTMNNVDDPADVGAPVPKIRALIFTEAVLLENYDADSDGGLTMRAGSVRASNVGTSSGWSNPYLPREEFVVQGTELKRRWPDGSLSVLRSGLTAGLRMAFVQVNDVVAYSNGVESGVIEHGVCVDPFVPTEPFKLPMVAGHFLEFYNGRLYALRNMGGQAVLYCSGSMTTPGGIESMDQDACRAWIFNGTGTMLQRVDTGLFVSAGGETFYLHGDDPFAGEGFVMKSIAAHGAVPYTGCPIPADELGIEGLTGWACLWVSSRHVCVGGNGGFFAMQEKLALQPGRSGAAMVRRQGGQVHYVAVTRDVAAEENVYVPRTISVDSN